MKNLIKILAAKRNPVSTLFHVEISLVLWSVFPPKSNFQLMEVNLLLVGKYGRLKSSFWIPSRSRNEQPKRNILIQLNLAFSWWGLLIRVCSSWFLAPWLLWDTDKTCGCLAGVDAGKHLLPYYGSLTTSAMTSLPHESRVLSRKHPGSLLNNLSAEDSSLPCAVSALGSRMPIFLFGATSLKLE